MANLGQMEIEYYQLTPVGVQRVQSGTYPRTLSSNSKAILDYMAKSGGTAEIDELKFIAQANPMVIRGSLRDLVDLGYVTPVGMPGGGE